MITHALELFIVLIVIGLFLIAVNVAAGWIIERITTVEEWKKQKRRQA